MSAIFLSHSSADDQAAAEVRAWLESQGHRSVFLDFDPAQGIPAGRSWEQELYRQLRACRAVIVLCSQASMASRWCFAEITHGRSMGKQIFPVKVADCQVDPVLLDRQLVDLTVSADAERQVAFGRLGRGLLAAGIDPADLHDWDASRSPYPGLLAFQEADAAIFFGRDAEIGASLDALQRARRQSGSALVQILGASGSGKSSLLRAGLLPRLRRDQDSWLVVGPLLPGEEPLAQLAGALARVFAAAGRPRDWQAIRHSLGAPGRRPGRALLELLEDLRLGSQHPEASAVLVVDQFEELLGRDADHPAHEFLEHLAAAIEGSRDRFLVLVTLRSDFLGSFQNHPHLAGLETTGVPVGPLSPEGLAQVIVRPAELAGLDLEAGLTQAILDDVTSEDALPLMAFTLRELYESDGADGKLGLRAYRDSLGGLQGAVARAADRVLADLRLEGEALEGLRRALLAMVRLNEAGQYARRPVAVAELPPEVLPHLERFVKARLLVARGGEGDNSLEVAHEALLRRWTTLTEWLKEDREILYLRHELGEAATRWQAAGRAEEYEWRKGRLQRLLDLVQAGHFQPGELEQAFLDASTRSVRLEERRRRLRRRAILGGALVVALMALGVAIWTHLQRRAAERQLARVVAVQALTVKDQIDRALLLSLEAHHIDPSFESGSSLLSLLSGSARLQAFLARHRQAVWAVAVSPDGRLVASGSDDRTIHVVPREGTREGRDGAFDLKVGQVVHDLAFSPDGGILAAALASGDVELWSLGEKRPLKQLRDHQGAANAVAFSPQRRWLVSGGKDALVRVWDEVTGEVAFTLPGHEGGVEALAFHPEGRILATAGEDRAVRLWDLDERRQVAALEGYPKALWAVAFSPDGGTVAAAGTLGGIWLWDGRSAAPFARLGEDLGQIEGLVFNQAGGLISGGDDGQLRLWDPATGDQTWLGVHPAVIRDVALAPDGHSLISCGNDNSVRLWDAGPGPYRLDLDGHRGILRNVALSPDRRWGASGGDDGSVRIWNLATGRLHRVLTDLLTGVTAEIWTLAFSPDGQVLAGGAKSGQLWLWRVETGELLWQDVSRAPGWVWSVAFQPGGELMAVGRDGGFATLRRLGDGQVLRRWQAHKERLRTLTFSLDGAALYTGGGEGVIYHWRVADGEKLPFASDGYQGGVMNLELQAGHPAVAGGRPVLAAAAADGSIRISDARSGELLFRLHGHDEEVRDLVFDPYGRFLASASRDRTLQVWDLAGAEAHASTGARIGTGDGALYQLFGHTDRVDSVVFDPGPTPLPAGGTRTDASLAPAALLSTWRLISGGGDATIRHWLLDPRQLEHAVCNKVRRPLSEDEWDDYIGDHFAYEPACAP